MVYEVLFIALYDTSFSCDRAGLTVAHVSLSSSHWHYIYDSQSCARARLRNGRSKLAINLPVPWSWLFSLVERCFKVHSNTFFYGLLTNLHSTLHSPVLALGSSQNIPNEKLFVFNCKIMNLMLLLVLVCDIATFTFNSELKY